MNILKVPEILLPKKGIDLKKWSVIACDQFTSDKKYWAKLEDYCGDISTLRITYPEIYLNDNQDERIKTINETMQKYLDKGIFEAYNGFILTVRKTSYGNTRIGLIVSFDLEQYEVGKKLAVRATEATVKERLPVRIKIRENSPIELPHALVLIDDEKKRVIEPLYENRNNLKKLYETELNMDGGSIEGYLVEDTKAVMDIIEEVTSEDNCFKKYGDKTPFIFAVGDGNHSIATAKACWDKVKANLTDEEKETHPARFCLVEINNIYDDNLKFEPIHRVVFGADEKFIEKMSTAISGDDTITLYYKGKEFTQSVPSNSALAIKEIQAFIDDYIANNATISQDYVHGKEDAYTASDELNGVAILMPKLKKSDLFPFVAQNGTLTRKSFSMGEAKEKRYYFECKKIK